MGADYRLADSVISPSGSILTACHPPDRAATRSPAGYLTSRCAGGTTGRRDYGVISDRHGSLGQTPMRPVADVRFWHKADMARRAGRFSRLGRDADLL